MPDYYAEKLNLFVALAPIGITHNMDNPRLQKYAPDWRLIQIAAEKAGAYNIIGVNWWEEESLMVFCSIFEGFCEEQL
jgi:hypothetical protein